jgi:hypothetical protein
MIKNKDFRNDKDLLKSFNKLSKKEFLETYEYIHELEYNATRRRLNNNIKNMSEDYSISVPFTDTELQEMLHEDKSFLWVFPVNENENVQITVHLHKEE